MAPGGHAGAAGAGGAVAQVWQEGKCGEWAGGAGAQVRRARRWAGVQVGHAAAAGCVHAMLMSAAKALQPG